MKIPRGKLYISFKQLLVSFFKVLFNIDQDKNFKVNKFNDLVKNYYSRNFCYSFSTARVSLYCYLKSLDLNEGDEVLMTPIQIPDFINVVNSLNLKPVFLNINEDDHSINKEDLINQTNNKTKVIIITHYHGVLGDIKNIKKFCDDNSIILIEDISHAYGSVFDNKLAGTFGHAAIGSLSPGKIVTSIGGGFLIFDNNIINSKIKTFYENNLEKPKKKLLFKIIFFQLMVKVVTSKIFFGNFFYYIFLLLPKVKKENNFKNKTYLNSKIETIYANPVIIRELPKYFFYYFLDFQAEIAISTFNRNLKSGIKKRQNFVKKVIENLSDGSKFLIPKTIFSFENWAFWHFPIVLKNDDVNKCKNYFLKNSIDIVGYGMINCNKEKAFERFKRQNLIVAEKIYDNTLFLPIHDSFGDEEAIKISKVLNSYVKNPTR